VVIEYFGFVCKARATDATNYKSSDLIRSQLMRGVGMVEFCILICLFDDSYFPALFPVRSPHLEELHELAMTETTEFGFTCIQ
jgi:hypothetical protein